MGGLGSETSVQYIDSVPVLPKLPKLIIEDVILFSMNLVLVVFVLRKVTFATFVSAAFSIGGLVLACLQASNYYTAVRVHREFLAEEIKYRKRDGKPSNQLESQLENLDANPLNYYCFTADQSGDESE